MISGPTRPLTVLAPLFAAVILAAACAATPPVMFYTLSPLSAGGAQRLGDAGPLVGLGPVTVPEVLDRPQIVTRTSANRIEVSELHRWGGSLKDALPRVLAHDLAVHLGSEQVAIYPWRTQVKPDYRISVDILQLDGRLGEGVDLLAAWKISPAAANGRVHVHRSAIRTPVTGSDYEAFVAAQSRAIAELAESIAAAILTLEGQDLEKR